MFFALHVSLQCFFLRLDEIRYPGPSVTVFFPLVLLFLLLVLDTVQHFSIRVLPQGSGVHKLAHRLLGFDDGAVHAREILCTTPDQGIMLPLRPLQEAGTGRHFGGKFILFSCRLPPFCLLLTRFLCSFLRGGVIGILE